LPNEVVGQFKYLDDWACMRFSNSNKNQFNLIFRIRSNKYFKLWMLIS